MVFKRFSIASLIRVILLAITVYLLFYLYFKTELVITTLFMALLSLAQVVALVRFIGKTNRDLVRFLQAIEFSDFSQTYISGLKGSAFEDLNREFDKVLTRFRKIRMEREENYHYLQTVIQHVAVGLITYRRDGTVEMVNNAARRLLQISAPRNIEQLDSVNPALTALLRDIDPGDKDLIKVTVNGRLLLLSVYATGFILRGEQYRLVALQDIQNEMEEKEMEAWHNLIRVLTHEIMNSITPISSLAATANAMVNTAEFGGSADEETIADLQSALSTIEKRSRGLIAFLDDYRKLTRIPAPKFQRVGLAEIIAGLTSLLQDQLDRDGIRLKTAVDPPDLKIMADRDLLEQVLINIGKNAIEAVRGVVGPQIGFAARIDGHGNPLIEISDNGCGIEPEVIENIFIPFFTTKPDGNGIGLSLSREIVRRHKGRLEVESEPGRGAVFTLYL
ncbi:MAG: ATP-binding protein [Candidatus Neomarinimicrobiota bacterium]